MTRSRRSPGWRYVTKNGDHEIDRLEEITVRVLAALHKAAAPQVRRPAHASLRTRHEHLHVRADHCDLHGNQDLLGRSSPTG